MWIYLRVERAYSCKNRVSSVTGRGQVVSDVWFIALATANIHVAQHGPRMLFFLSNRTKHQQHYVCDIGICRDIPVNIIQYSTILFTYTCTSIHCHYYHSFFTHNNQCVYICIWLYIYNFIDIHSHSSYLSARWSSYPHHSTVQNTGQPSFIKLQQAIPVMITTKPTWTRRRVYILSASNGWLPGETATRSRCVCPNGEAWTGSMNS